MLSILINIFLFSSSFKRLEQDLDYKVHALFLYHFTKYVNWPIDKSERDFLIIVLGNDVVAEELKRITRGKTVQGSPIRVENRKSDYQNVQGAWMVFVSQAASRNFEKIRNSIGSEPVLLISEHSGYCERGAHISFLLAGDKLRFDVNRSAMQKQGFEISGELLKLSNKVL